MNLIELLTYKRPIAAIGDKFPGGRDQPGADLRISYLINGCNHLGTILGQQQMETGGCPNALSSQPSRDNGHSSSHGFQDLQPSAASDSQGCYHDHCRSIETSHIVNGPGHSNPL